MTTAETRGGTDHVQRLRVAARDAAEIRSLANRPDVLALRIERIERRVDTLLWTGIGLGLLFTMVNVQRFAAADAAVYSPVWWAAWLLDPMVSLVLLAVVHAEQVTARAGMGRSTWARITKWSAFAATYVMNTWEAWGLGDEQLSAAGIVLHSIPPVLVLLAAEAGPELRERMHEAALRAHAADAREPDTATGLTDPPAGEGRTAVRERAAPRAREQPREPASVRRPSRTREVRCADRAPRRLLGEYLADARAALLAATSAGEPPVVTPSWCRRVTGCSAGTSVKLVAALRNESPA